MAVHEFDLMHIKLINCSFVVFKNDNQMESVFSRDFILKLVSELLNICYNCASVISQTDPYSTSMQKHSFGIHHKLSKPQLSCAAQ